MKKVVDKTAITRQLYRILYKEQLEPKDVDWMIATAVRLDANI